MKNSSKDYIYVLEDAAGNTEEIKPEDGLKRLQEGVAFKLKIYRIWRVYGEVDNKKPEQVEYEPVTAIAKLCKSLERKQS